jgi:hypothetical protein
VLGLLGVALGARVAVRVRASAPAMTSVVGGDRWSVARAVGSASCVLGVKVTKSWFFSAGDADAAGPGRRGGRRGPRNSTRGCSSLPGDVFAVCFSGAGDERCRPGERRGLRPHRGDECEAFDEGRVATS